MKNYKKIFLLLLITSFIMTMSLDVKAAVKLKPAGTSTNYKKTCVTDGSDKDVEKKYQLSVKLGANPGTYHLKAQLGVFKIVKIEEGWVYDSDDHFEAVPTIVSLDAADITKLMDPTQSLIVGEDSTTNKKGQTITVNAKSYIDTSTKTTRERVLKVTVELARSDEYCQTEEDFQEAAKTDAKRGKYSGYFYLTLRDFTVRNATEVNTNYNLGACQTLRTGVMTKDSKGQDAINQAILNRWNSTAQSSGYYKRLVKNCYDAYVEYNYDEDNIRQMVQTAILSYYAQLLKNSAVVKSQNWDVSYERACQEGGGRVVSGVCQGASGEHFQPNLGDGATPSTNTTLECKYEWKDLGEDTKNGIYQYTNIHSYYAKSVHTEPVSYVTQYDGLDPEENDEFPNACVRTCEEVVDVEYGPPQAAVAGFCIQYQVKVTSHVMCNTEINVTPPEQKPVCQPVPNCVHTKYTSTQAGPNEEFNTCIYNCDGGKYTDSCSKKCYNKVYASSTKENLADSFNTNGTIEFMADIPTGGYYTRSGGKIVWVSNGGTRSKKNTTYAQWYIDNESSRTINDDEANGGSYFADAGGFKRKQISNSKECDGECEYQGCGNNSYLTAERAQADYSTNMDSYNEAINKCVAAATCTTKTAKFNISVDVNRKNITYPKTLTGADNDTLSTKDELSERAENRVQGTLLSYAGCYKDGNEKNWYQGEWSFPGTWVNNKTGEISFTKPADTSVWHQTKNKFCLPLTVETVNEKWWNYYMNKKAENSTNKPATGSYTSTEYSTKYPGISAVNSVSKSDITYNIHAQTQQFGYFGWQFNIDCFYAVGGNSNCKDGTCVSPDNYTTRTVINKDLFPSDDKDNPIATTDPKETGRQQGFNWTAAATITSDKNPSYAVNPQLLIQKIQTTGSKIYDEEKESEYLDYEFRLDTQALNAIKRLNYESSISSGNYTTWLGESIYNQEKKIYIYKSGLFRGNGVISEKKYAWKIPAENKLGCNNTSCTANDK